MAHVCLNPVPAEIARAPRGLRTANDLIQGTKPQRSLNYDRPQRTPLDVIVYETQKEH